MRFNALSSPAPFIFRPSRMNEVPPDPYKKLALRRAGPFAGGGRGVVVTHPLRKICGQELDMAQPH